MIAGFTDNFQDISKILKTAVIDWELNMLQENIAALQETRFTGSNSVREVFTLFWQGKSQDKTRNLGIEFPVKNSLVRSIIPPTDGIVIILLL